MSARRVLIVDDDPAIRFGVRDFLTGHGFEVLEAGTCADGERMFRSQQPDAAIIDHRLPDGDALALLSRLRDADPGAPVVVLTAHGSIDLAVQAIKIGAEQFLTKPIEMATLLLVLERALANQRNRRSLDAVRSQAARAEPDPFLGTSAGIRALAEQARRVAEKESPVLIEGETGAGKGVLARWLHANGPRADEAFVDLNCAGLSRDFLEAELFGHQKGAFTGAVAAKAGLLEVADRGAVFLDEIGDMDPAVQPKLLKALEEKRFYRLGDVRERRVDVRLFAATHQDLPRLVREGRFRNDLYFRVSTLPLRVPPLRERTEDVPVLARALLARLAADCGSGAVDLTSAAEAALIAHPWPGNVRELRNVLERALLTTDRRALDRDALRFDTAPAAPDATDAALTLAEVEKRHIVRVLGEEGGRVEAAAARLGIPRSTLYQRLRRHGIEMPKR